MSFYSIDNEFICDLWVQTLDQTQSLCQGIFFLRGGRWLGFYSWETETQRSVNFSTKQNQLHRSKLKRHWSLKSTGKTPYSCSPDTGWPWSLCGCVDDWLLQLWRTARLNVKENLWEAWASVSLFVRWPSFSLQRIAFFSIDTYFLSEQHTPNNQTKKKKKEWNKILFIPPGARLLSFSQE